jgi:hypothetical protein
MYAVITAERPDTADAIKLIEELEGELAPQYPSESRHGYSIEKLLKQYASEHSLAVRQGRVSVVRLRNPDVLSGDPVRSISVIWY